MCHGSFVVYKVYNAVMMVELQYCGKMVVWGVSVGVWVGLWVVGVDCVCCVVGCGLFFVVLMCVCLFVVLVVCGCVGL